ncbi:MAG TPA: hypothetical protein VIQ55_06125, partial [Burkholderiales bacterium]
LARLDRCLAALRATCEDETLESMVTPSEDLLMIPARHTGHRKMGRSRGHLCANCHDVERTRESSRGS